MKKTYNNCKGFLSIASVAVGMKQRDPREEMLIKYEILCYSEWKVADLCVPFAWLVGAGFGLCSFKIWFLFIAL